jgi:citrate lyase subunit beta/citryl-CoA lyase
VNPVATGRVPLSYLYVPGDADRRLALADTRGADAVIADLEDAVSAAGKPLARQLVRAWLSHPASNRVERWVRINAGQEGLDDLADVFGPGLRGVCIPKVSRPTEVERVGHLLGDLERSHGRSQEPVALMPLIESAEGLQALPETARVSRVVRLQLGELDLAADLGIEPGPDEIELLSARSAVVTASAAARLVPPLGAVRADVRDNAALARSTRLLRRLGFLGRAAVHPDQVPVIHAAFDVTPEEIRAARAVLSAYDDALAAGRGVLLDEHGRMIDEAVVRRSRRIVAIARDREALA